MVPDCLSIEQALELVDYAVAARRQVTITTPHPINLAIGDVATHLTIPLRDTNVIIRGHNISPLPKRWQNHWFKLRGVLCIDEAAIGPAPNYGFVLDPGPHARRLWLQARCFQAWRDGASIAAELLWEPPWPRARVGWVELRDPWDPKDMPPAGRAMELLQNLTRRGGGRPEDTGTYTPTSFRAKLDALIAKRLNAGGPLRQTDIATTMFPCDPGMEESSARLFRNWMKKAYGHNWTEHRRQLNTPN